MDNDLQALDMEWKINVNRQKSTQDSASGTYHQYQVYKSRGRSGGEVLAPYTLGPEEY